MQKLFLSLSILFFLSGCGVKITQIGKLNMVSNRNISDKTEYQLLSSYTKASKKEMKKNNFKDLEAAMDFTVKKVPGGEYLMNPRFYLLTKGTKSYFFVEGDVWGNKIDANYAGLHIGDQVIIRDKRITKLFNLKKDFLNATLVGFKTSEIAIVEYEGRRKEVPIEKITKAED